jgi:hypothetical protein
VSAEASAMTLPQALRRAATKFEQCQGSYSETSSTITRYHAALAAFLAAGNALDYDWDEADNDDYIFQETQHLGWRLDAVIEGPEGAGKATRLDVLWYMNDTLRWSFTQIAAWFETHDGEVCAHDSTR